VASYRIELKRSAAKEIEQIRNAKELKRIIDRIGKLSENPRPVGAEKLSGSDHYRIRQGQYRIVYSIFDDILLVEVVKVGHRRDVYR
jgi:mRNA interferase RelE/StbE